MSNNTFWFKGRIYNALTKFCGKSEHKCTVRPFVAEDGNIYATNTFVMVRWTPTTPVEVERPFGFEPVSKLKANQDCALNTLGCNEFFEEDCGNFPSVESLRKLFTPMPKPSLSDFNYDSKYVELAVGLAKAVHAGKNGTGAMDINIANAQLFISIESNIGIFDIVIMPRRK